MNIMNIVKNSNKETFAFVGEKPLEKYGSLSLHVEQPTSWGGYHLYRFFPGRCKTVAEKQSWNSGYDSPISPTITMGEISSIRSHERFLPLVLVQKKMVCLPIPISHCNKNWNEPRNIWTMIMWNRWKFNALNRNSKEDICISIEALPLSGWYLLLYHQHRRRQVTSGKSTGERVQSLPQLLFFTRWFHILRHTWRYMFFYVYVCILWYVFIYNWYYCQYCFYLLFIGISSITYELY